MRKIILFIPGSLISIFLFAQTTKIAKGDKIPGNMLYAGTSKILITPGTPIPMSGYGGRNAPFKGVHDDLFARVIAFSDGVNKAILITTDLIGISNSIWEETTKRISKETGIKKEYVLLSAVHNHGGPVIKVYEDDSSAEVNAYVEELQGKIVIATKDALSKLVRVRIGAGKGECKMNINRRAPDGKGEISLGRNPYAPCDHEVGVISIEDNSGSLIAIIMNWPCHGVVLGPRNYLITGDWPGAASRYVEEGAGGKLIAPVIVGASGDINPIYGPHIDFEDHNAYAYGKDAIGEDLGKESMRISKEIQAFSSGKITALQRVISLPAKEKEETQFLQPASGKDDSLQVRLSAVKIGRIILTGVSGEVFNQISVKMRNQSPYSFTFMITHCNGSSGYLVSEDAYPKKGISGSENKYIPIGGYEVGSTRAKTGAEKAIIENLLQMINEL
ncbi:MAG: neutral/alkaline non-lysosomal ceramidase N-terminal domain-containing protein [Ferruginibacter sp.]